MNSYLKRFLIFIIVLIGIVALFTFFHEKTGVFGSNIMTSKKPNIYFYPTKTENIEVRLYPRGWISKSIPLYKDGWKIKIEPSGKINSSYDYLFYEAKLKYPFTIDKGWIVKKSEFQEEMNDILIKIGLNCNERKDFMEYWSKELKWETDTYAIYYISSKEINDAIPLEISDKPDSLLRVLFYFKPVTEPMQIEEPQIKTFERNGFTVVEWGGIGE